MTATERLQLLVGGFGEEQAARALELLSPLIGADARRSVESRPGPSIFNFATSSQVWRRSIATASGAKSVKIWVGGAIQRYEADVFGD